MASSSTSFVQKCFRYDVFISFRGEDTRKTFVDHLYSALKDKGILSYKDDKEIRQGRKISDELMNSIENSKLYIIVFSKNYASSSWCLDELVKIMECQKAADQIAYPVFYDVEPTQVRKQIGAVGEAFAKHVNAKDAGKWRGALKEAADLAGLELKTTANGHEAEFIKKIVEKISLELPPIWSGIDENLIGMKSRVEDVVSSLEIGNDDVRVIGIKGIGGGGKTTLARAVFAQISHTFEGQSFVANVREVSKASGLKSVQKQILSDVFKDKYITVNNVHDGKDVMKRRMPSRRVLVVLDDVDHIDQLEAIVPEWFKPGSRIIVTTRDEKVLKVRGVKLITLHVNLLSKKEAISLFSRYAFGSENIIQGYEKLSEQVVRYAAGLPLTIRVLGSFLFGEDKPEWEDALKRLQTIPLEETLKKLEISYIGLEDDYKEIFLDVVCFHRFSKKKEVIRALESQGFNARIGLRVLEQKSLITIDEDNWLNMHDHIEEMGKNIVRRSDPDEPWRHRRLWIEAEIKDILANDQGTEATRGIQFESEEFEYNEFEYEILMNGLQNMKKLRFLYLKIGYLYGSKIGKCCPYLPNSLQYLQWDYFPFECLPITFTDLNHLRYLKIKWSKLVTFDFELLPNLETLILLECNNTVKFHIPKGCPKLKYLDLRSPSALRILNLGPTPRLETLMFNECLDLVELRIHFLCLKLKSIVPKSSKSTFLDLGCTIDLEMLDLKACDSFELHLTDGCPNLKKLKLGLSNLRNLTLGPAPNLESLGLYGCCDLVEFHLRHRYPMIKSIIVNDSKLKTLDLRLISDLATLRLERCDLVELQMPEECPNLKDLNLRHVSKLRNLTLGLLPNLESITLDECYEIVELQMLEECPNLKHLNIRYLSKLRNLTLRLLPNLESISLDWCDDLEELQMPEECPNLKHLNICYLSKLRNLTLRLLPNLESISLEWCDDLEELQMPEECPNLKHLNLLHVSKLRNLTLGLLPNLESISLDRCDDLEELYMPYRYSKLKSIMVQCAMLKTLDLRMISNLETLHLDGCEMVELLQMPEECPNLKHINLRRISKLRNLILGPALNLESITLDEWYEIVELHLRHRYPKLKSIMVECSMLKILDLRMISNLETLRLERCEMVELLQMPEERPNLKHLNLRRISKLRNLILGPAPNLETLSLVGCCDLEQLHMRHRYPKLKSIILTASKLKTLDLGLISNLNTLRLERCDLVELLQMPDECPNLKHLYLSRLSKLRNFTLGLLPNLESISLDECYEIVELQMPEECPNLKHLNLKGLSKLRNLTLGLAPNLDSISLDGCCDLVQLHMPYRYPKLNSLKVSSSKLKTLCLRLISHLETLCLEKCGLVEFQMPEECPNLKDLNLSYLFKLRNLTLGLAPNLESITLYECDDLEELYMPHKYPKLKSIMVQHSMLKTLDLRMISNLETLRLDGCEMVQLLQMPEECPNLKCLNLRLSKLRNLTLGLAPNLCAVNFQSFTLSVYHLRFIKKLTLEGDILEAPNDLDQLRCLEELNFSTKKIKNLPDSLCMLKQLKTLRFESCWLIEKLPEDIGVLECLEKLVLTDCIYLRGIPNSICKIRRLKNLHVTHCFLVEKLPEEIGVLKSLKELNIQGSGINRLPLSIFQLKGLCIVGTKWRLQSYGFTSLMQSARFETFCFI